MATTTKGPGEAKTYDGSALRIGIIHARWNTRIISALVDGCIAELQKSGVKDENIVVQSVPGSYELPYAAQRMYMASQQQSSGLPGQGLVTAAQDLLGGSTTDLTSLPVTRKEEGQVHGEAALGPKEVEKAGGSKGTFDAIVAVGALIKGSTMHFEYISDSVSQGLMRVQLETGCPVVFGLLTLLNEEQGFERAGIDEGKKMHNHGIDWGQAAVELGVKRKAWAEGRYVE